MDSNEHFYEAAYEVWRRGGNPDRLSFERAENDFYNGLYPEDTAQKEIKRQKPSKNEAEDYEINPHFW